MKFSLRIASFSAPIIALAISFGLSSLILLFIGKDPVETFRIMFEYGVKGKSIDDAYKIENTEIVEELALPPVKIHCSVLAEDAIKAAIEDFRKKNEFY